MASLAGTNTVQDPGSSRPRALRYVLVTPVRNEAQHIQQTIDSVLAQTLPPAGWVLVDDGSTDQTPAIIDAAAALHPWIRTLHRPDRGFRKSGGGVIEAFNQGLALVPCPKPLEGAPSRPWDFLVKLDGDLQFGPDYFARCFEEFARNPKLGIGGGLVCQNDNGTWVEEVKGDPAFHVRGATKIYRRACWEGLGGLIPAPGWDTLDELKANMLGWTTYTFRDIKLLQLKSTGTADGTWKNWVKNGRANYITGYHPVFMLLKCLKRTIQRPYGLGALGLMAGFISGYLGGQARVGDAALIKYVRGQQWNLILGKPSLWNGRGWGQPSP